MHIGRRPAGVCGACLLLAARMNNFRRSITEVVQVVKIADVTLRKRLGEFKETASGALTVADFRTLWLDETADPPAFSAGLKREQVARERLEEVKRKKEEGGSDEEEEEAAGKAFAELAAKASSPAPSRMSESPAPLPRRMLGKRKRQEKNDEDPNDPKRLGESDDDDDEEEPLEPAPEIGRAHV